MTKAGALLARNDLIHSLFDTASAYLDQIGDYEKRLAIEKSRWQHIEICLSSESSIIELFEVGKEQSLCLKEESLFFDTLNDIDKGNSTI